MATKKKSGEIMQASADKPQGSGATTGTESQPRQKVDELVEIIRSLANADGLFDPKDVHEKARDTDLAKSASIIMSNLRLQGFAKGDKLRIPVSNRPDAIKKLINLASRLRKKGIMIPFDEAVSMILSEPPEASEEAQPEPRKRPAVAAQAKSEPMPQERVSSTTASPVAPITPSQASSLQKPEADFKALYEESKDKSLKLEAELEAYKRMCFHLIDTFKK